MTKLHDELLRVIEACDSMEAATVRAGGRADDAEIAINTRWLRKAVEGLSRPAHPQAGEVVAWRYAADVKIVADTMAEMQRQIETLTGARHSMYDPAIAIARGLSAHPQPHAEDDAELREGIASPMTEAQSPAPTIQIGEGEPVALKRLHEFLTLNGGASGVVIDCDHVMTIAAEIEALLGSSLRDTQPGAEGAVVASETWASMARWTEETFGPVSLERIATRASEEMQELLADPSDVTEAADVCIVLSRYPGIEDAINRKMAINRQREWRLNGDGSGYHVKPEAARQQPPASPGEVA